MKQFIWWSLSVTALLTLPALSALAQDQSENLKAKLAAEVQAKIEITKAIGTKYSFETKVVKGAPYSATAESETIHMLTDGNRIRTKTTTTIYRDSEGRTRREVTGKTPGVADEIFINDPASGANYVIDPQLRTAMKSQPNLKQKLILEEKMLAEQAVNQKMGERQPTINVDGQTLRWDQLSEDQQRAATEKKARAEQEMKASGNLGTADAGGMFKKRPGASESLGQQMIEGVLCDGKRTILTIPANSIGNDLPINIVSEEWYSPELQVLVLTKHSDPRSGETTYRLTNLNRSEPDRILFEVPSDYTVRENKMLAKPKPTKEEE